MWDVRVADEWRGKTSGQTWNWLEIEVSSSERGGGGRGTSRRRGTPASASSGPRLASQPRTADAGGTLRLQGPSGQWFDLRW